MIKGRTRNDLLKGEAFLLECWEFDEGTIFEYHYK
jgi:hypothetical protein